MAGLHTPVVRGRDAQLAILGEQLDRVRGGAGALVLVEGGAGMGKSRLLDEAVAVAHRLSFRVGTGVAESGDGVVQLAALMAALFDGPEPLLQPELLRDLPALPEQQYWLLQDIQALLEEAALQTPLLLCLDDMQWADSGTVAALRTLPRRLAALPIAWVIAARPDHGSAQLRDAIKGLENGRTAKIVIGPLDDIAVAQVAADVMGAEPGVALLKMAERALGSPFLLAELLLGLREEQLVRVESGRAELVEARLPRRVRDSMQERLARVSEPARQAATVAVALGRKFSFSDLAKMLDLSPPALLAPVGELIKCGVLIEWDDGLAFRHDLTREAVRGSLPVSALRALDRQAADVLLAAGALPVEVAAQLAVSAEPGDEVAITTLLKAAGALVTSDPGTAADLSQRALELAPSQHPLRGPLVAQTAVSLHAAGRGEEAKAFAETSLRDTLPSEQEAEVRLSIAGMFALSPDVRADAGRQALALDNLPVDLRGRHLARLVHNLYVADRPQEARANLAEARDTVGVSGDAAAAFTLALAEGGLEYADSRFRQSLEMIEDAARSGFATRDYARESLAQLWRCELMMVLDYVDEPLQLAADKIAAAQRDRQGWVLQVFETWRGRQLLQIGRLHDAAASLEGRFDPDDAHVVSILDAAGLVALGRAALHIGDARRTRQTAQIAELMLKQSVPGVRRHGAWLLALQAMADGDATGARAHLSEPDDANRKSILPRNPIDVTDEPHFVRIALAAEDVELAEQSVAAAERRAELNHDVRSMSAAAAHARGLFTGSREDLASAVGLFDNVLRPLAQASALEDLGLAEIRRGATSEAVEALDRSLVLYADAGASRDAGRLRGRLRALGVRRRLVSAERPETGWAAMTHSELAVARLVAEGLTNRQVAEQLFVSPHTVSSHLRHVFAKLDVNSRVELTRLAVEQNQSPREPVTPIADPLDQSLASRV